MSSDLDRFGIYFCEILTLYRTVVTLYWPSVVLWDCSLGVDNAEKYDMEFSKSNALLDMVHYILMLCQILRYSKMVQKTLWQS